MGKQSNSQQRENIRQYREERRRAELEKQKKQNQILWGTVAGVLAVILLIVSIPLIVSGCEKKQEQEREKNLYAPTDYVRMDVSYTDQYGNAQEGSIIVELYGNLAPITVKNFTKLTSEKFYDGLTFHRVIENFMIQGGDPKGNSSGDSGERIKGEFSANGVENPLLHERGVISMARGESMNSASCQFFIVHKTSPHLDGQYAAFGRVIQGMETVDAIAVIDTASNDKPLDSVVIRSMYLISADQIPQTTAQQAEALIPEDKRAA